MALRAISYLRIAHDPLRGCPVGRLVADTEVVADDPLRTPVARALDGIRTHLAALLADDPVCAGHDVDAIAAAVVAVIQGGYVLARAADDRAPYDAAVALLPTHRRGGETRRRRVPRLQCSLPV